MTLFSASGAAVAEAQKKSWRLNKFIKVRPKVRTTKCIALRENLLPTSKKSIVTQ